MVIQDRDRRGLTMALVDIRMTNMCKCLRFSVCLTVICCNLQQNMSRLPVMSSKRVLTSSSSSSENAQEFAPAQVCTTKSPTSFIRLALPIIICVS